MAEDFIQSPPDSTGKRVHTKMVNDGTNDIYTPVHMLADRDNPSQRQVVDTKGAARVAFPNGAPSFDVFGRTKSSESKLMEMFKFYNKDYNETFHKVETGTATVDRDVVMKGMRISTGTGATDLGSYQTHRYFHYRPGCSMELTWTMMAGDIGKTNLTRQAGWICDNDGLYMEWGNVSHYCVVKDGNSNITTKIERANWNIDVLDGSGNANNLSGASLDVTKNNIWWVAFQFLGAGDVTFGTWVDGKRVAVHHIKHYNTLDRPYLSMGSIPFGFRQFNTGITSSSSEMRVYCAVITNEGYAEYDRNPVMASNGVTITSDSVFAPVISFRPSALNAGMPNRARILAQMATLLAEDASVEFKSVINGTLTGATWGLTENVTDFDLTASAISGGKNLMVQIVSQTDSTLVDLRDLFLLSKSGIVRDYDNLDSAIITVCARLIVPGSSYVHVALNLTEID